MDREFNVTDIERTLAKSFKKIVRKPTKKQLDRCKEKAREIWAAFYSRSYQEVLEIVRAEVQEIAWEE